MSSKPPGPELTQVDHLHVLEKGRRLLYFGGCDYFRLAWNAQVRRAVRQATIGQPVTVAASRTTTGNHPLYGRLEKVLARFFGEQTATLASSGYATTWALSQALAGEFTHVLIDEKAHQSLVDAVGSWKGTVRRFRHADPDHAGALARRWPSGAKPILVTDGMFAHDGSMAPLQAYRSVLPGKTWIWVDDAHAAGLMGGRGRGTPEWDELHRKRLIQSFSLSKAFGTYGGAILGDRSVREKLRRRAAVLAGNTPLPLPLAAGALEAIHQLETHPEWRQKLASKTVWLKRQLRGLDWPCLNTPGPIVSWIPQGNPQRLIRRLRDAGIYPSFIRYQGSEGYFRFAISSAHGHGHLKLLASVLRDAAR